MGSNIKLLAFLIGLVFFFFILLNIRKKVFSPAISSLWIIVTIFLLSISIFEKFYQFIAHEIIGINDARHIIYIFTIGFLMIYNFFLSSKITELSNQVKLLISNLSILENSIKRLKSLDKNKK